DVYVIDKDKEKLERFVDLDVITIKGNAGNLKVLKNAKVEKADYFLAVTGNDEINLISALAAKKLGAKKTLVRIENPEYVDSPVVRYHPLGFDVVICPSLALAQEAVRVAGILPAVGVITLDKEMEILEIQVAPDSDIVGKSVRDLELPPETLIISICRNGKILSPEIEKIEVGDRIEILGKHSEINKLRGIFGEQITNKITIFGTGNITSYMIELLKERNVAIKVFGMNKKACEELIEKFRDIKVIFGNYLDVNVLIEEEVGKSDVVLAMTDSDERNLMISLISKKLGAKKTIAKVENRDYLEIFERVGVDKVLNPKLIAILEILKQLIMERVGIKAIAEIKGFAIVEIVVGEKLDGRKISELNLAENANVIAVIRDEKSLLPYQELQLKSGDKLLISAPWKYLNKLEEIQ
ncbi:MAG: Trk system potassium transporter TrkA, partial [Archaeoglobaceae archaeon]